MASSGALAFFFEALDPEQAGIVRKQLADTPPERLGLLSMEYKERFVDDLEATQF